MNNKINLDDVFRSSLRAHEIPFDEGAWANMQGKLAEDAVKPKLWIPLFSKKPFRLYVLIAVITLFFSSLFWVNFSSGARTVSFGNPSFDINKFHPVYINSGKINYKNTTVFSITSDKYSQKINDKNPPVINPLLTVNKAVKMERASFVITGSSQNFMINNLIDPLHLKPELNSLKEEEDSKDTDSSDLIKEEKHYNHATLGLHFLYANPLNDYANTGQMPGMGFDMEGYTGNVLSTSKVGLFFGISGSVAWMGKSRKTDVSLNTSNSQNGVALAVANTAPGKTFIKSNLSDLNLISKMEYGKGDMKIYMMAFGGFCNHSISQSIEFNKQVSGFENSSKEIWSKSAMQWGAGVGIRYHFYPGISLDIRGTYNDVDFMRLANVKESEYDASTAMYNLKYNVVEPKLFCIKIGFLFCLENFRDSGSGSTSFIGSSSSKGKSPVHINTTPKVNVPHPARIIPKVGN